MNSEFISTPLILPLLHARPAGQPATPRAWRAREPKRLELGALRGSSATLGGALSKGRPTGCQCGPIASLMGSEVWAAVLDMAHNGMFLGLSEACQWGAQTGTMGSTWDYGGVLGAT